MNTPNIYCKSCGEQVNYLTETVVFFKHGQEIREVMAMAIGFDDVMCLPCNEQEDNSDPRLNPAYMSLIDHVAVIETCWSMAAATAWTNVLASYHSVTCTVEQVFEDVIKAQKAFYESLDALKPSSPVTCQEEPDFTDDDLCTCDNTEDQFFQDHGACFYCHMC